jgi:hypothetical protein
VSAERIEFPQLAAALADLPPAPFEFLDRELSNGALALQLQQGIVGCEPLAGFNPFSEVDQQQAKPWWCDRRLRALERAAPFPVELLAERRQFFRGAVMWLKLSVGCFREPLGQNIHFARGPELAHDPLFLTFCVPSSRSSSPNSDIAARSRRTARAGFCAQSAQHLQ